MVDNLLSLIKDLQQRMEKLEKDNRELKKWACREKQKIDVIAWLNEHYLPSQDFSQWCASLKVQEKELQLAFEYRIEKGIYYIIERNLPLEERRHFPMIAFKHQRKSVFYVYEKESWRKIKKGEFKKIVISVNKKLFLAFNAWEAGHPKMLEEANREEWGKKLQRILLVPERTDPIVDRLEKRVHTYLALNLKNIVEYEFVF
jgi:hypothetical protein